MIKGNGNALRGSAPGTVAERFPHRGRSLNIANLPAEIRDELNWRINDGEQGSELVEWLNAKPEVMKVINDLFDGCPISEQNLSQWRTHGYRVWHAHRTIVDETHALSDNSEDIFETGIDCEKLLLALTASYAEMIRRWVITPGEEMIYKLRVFKEITNRVLALRHAEIQKARLEIQRERLELLREKQRNKSGSSSSSRVSSSADSASLESPESSSPAAAEAPEPNCSVIPYPPPSDEADTPHPPASATAESLSRPPAPDAASQAGPEPSIATSKPAAPTAPTAPQEALFSPNARPGALPRNANPRNPLGLL
jgi:hypothetical protein